MRHTFTTLVALGLTLTAQAYPLVSSDPNTVEQNVWNTGLIQAKAKAKALNRPTLMVMLDSVNCGYSKSWLANIVDTPAWQTFLAANPLLLVMVDKTKTVSSTWYDYSAPYREVGTGILYFPTVVLFRPDGSVSDYFIARGTLGSNPGFYNRVRTTTDQYPGTGAPPGLPAPGTIGFSQTSLTISEGAPSVSVTVTRQGGSSGAQTFSYATVAGTATAGVNYTGTGGTLVWGDGDASATTFTIGLVNDNQWTSPTARSFTLSLVRTSGTATLGTSTLTVNINEVSPPPTVSTVPSFAAPTPASGSAVSAVLNGAVSIRTSATGSAPIAYAVAGLPAGLSFNTATGLISGTPTVAGSSTVTVTASNGIGTATRSFTLTVAAQSALSASAYQGFFYEPNDRQTVRGTLTLSANAYGALKALAVLDGRSFTFTGTRPAGAAFTAELQSNTAADVLGVEVDESGTLTGYLGDASLFGRRATLSGATAFAGYYTALLGATETTANSDEIDNQPEGSGYVTFTVASRGSVSYKGALADGTLFSGAATLMTFTGVELADLGYTDVADDQNYACFALYSPLYSRRGVVAAQIWLDGNLSPTYEDNKVFLVGSQWVYPGKSVTASDDGFAATLDDGFFTEVGAAFFKPENLAAVFEGTSFETECGAVTVEASGTSIKLPSGNTLKATLTASATTGLFSGKVLYTPDSGASPYTVRFSGALVPALGIGAGYYLAPDTSFPGYTVKRSKPVVIAP